MCRSFIVTNFVDCEKVTVRPKPYPEIRSCGCTPSIFVTVTRQISVLGHDTKLIAWNQYSPKWESLGILMLVAEPPSLE